MSTAADVFVICGGLSHIYLVVRKELVTQRVYNTDGHTDKNHRFTPPTNFGT